VKSTAFLPAIADQMGVLTELTMKDSKRNFPLWMPKYQSMFDAIKTIVTGQDCLTTIDFKKMPEHKIFLTTDASNKHSGAVLSFGSTWETAHPVAFDSMTFKDAELNYLVHKKELLAVIQALKKWQVDLLQSPFWIYTDHKTLENFHSQKDLSHQQAHWMEFLSQYDARIVYIKGKDNSVADALSHLPCDNNNAETTAQHLYSFCEDDDTINAIACIYLLSLQGPWETATSLSTSPVALQTVNATLEITANKCLLEAIKAGYSDDAWCKTLSSASASLPALIFQDGLWYIGERLIIPRTGNI